MERMKETAPTAAVGRRIDGGQEAKTEILVNSITDTARCRRCPVKDATLFALAVVLLLITAGAIGQDPASVTPQTHKVKLENQYVRVLDIHVKPGQKVLQHSHPGYVVYALSPFKVKFTHPDGKTEVIEGKPGDTVWREAETHSAENVGTSELHVINIEVKSAKK